MYLYSNNALPILHNRDYIQTFCKNRKIIFILHVVNAIFITIHNIDIVYLHTLTHKYTNNYIKFRSCI